MDGSKFSCLMKIIYSQINLKFQLQDSNTVYQQQEYKLESKDLSKFPKCKWVEYTLPFTINTTGVQWIRPSIEGISVNMVSFIS